MSLILVNFFVFPRNDLNYVAQVLLFYFSDVPPLRTFAILKIVEYLTVASGTRIVYDSYFRDLLNYFIDLFLILIYVSFLLLLYYRLLFSFDRGQLPASVKPQIYPYQVAQDYILTFSTKPAYTVCHVSNFYLNY